MVSHSIRNKLNLVVGAILFLSCLACQPKHWQVSNFTRTQTVSLTLIDSNDGLFLFKNRLMGQKAYFSLLKYDSANLTMRSIHGHTPSYQLIEKEKSEKFKVYLNEVSLLDSLNAIELNLQSFKYYRLVAEKKSNLSSFYVPLLSNQPFGIPSFDTTKYHLKFTSDHYMADFHEFYRPYMKFESIKINLNDGQNEEKTLSECTKWMIQNGFIDNGSLQKHVFIGKKKVISQFSQIQKRAFQRYQ